MTRRIWLLLVPGFAACRRKPPTADALLPATLSSPPWKRTQLREPLLDSLPPEMPRASVRRVVEADYSGPASAQVTLFDLVSSAAALDLAQKWRPTPDTVFFYKGNYFVLVQWQNFDRQSLTGLIRALEQHLDPFAKASA
jgi:hypothetical protein